MNAQFQEPAWLPVLRQIFIFEATKDANLIGDKLIGITSGMIMTFERPNGTSYQIQAPVLIGDKFETVKRASDHLNDLKRKLAHDFDAAHAVTENRK